MNIDYRDKIITGDALEELRKMPSDIFNMCVTSPPYYGLRDYGKEGQIGLEESPEEYIGKLVEIFREVRRTLKDNGTLWLNLGDCYAGSGGMGGWVDRKAKKGMIKINNYYRNKPLKNLKPKDLIGIPWMVALALRNDGWYLRSDIIWNKPNPMPESVKDRPTKSHEYLFLLTKSQKYYYDYEAILEPANYDGRKDTIFKGSIKYNSDNNLNNAAKAGRERWPSKITGRTGDGHSGYYDKNGKYRGYKIKDNISNKSQHHGQDIMAKYGSNVPGHSGYSMCENPYLRNKRSVWTIPTKPYFGAHFAVYPPNLIIPCILAGCPEGGIVLDPFFGSGTTGEVANRLGRYYCGIELNEEYVGLAQKRLNKIDMVINK